MNTEKIFIPPAERQREQTIDFISRMLDHTKDLQIHIGNVRLKAIFGGAAFATALATVFIRNDNPTMAYVSFVFIYIISIPIEKRFRNLLYRWVSLHRYFQRCFIDAISGIHIDLLKLRVRLKSPVEVSRFDIVSTSHIIFFTISTLTILAITFDMKEIEKFSALVLFYALLLLHYLYYAIHFLLQNVPFL